jgi:hypothetical protein
MKPRHLSKVALALAAAVFCAFPSHSWAQTEDVTPPVLTALSFAPSINTATGPVTLTVQFSATDDLSGVRTMQVLFVSPSGHQQQGGASPNSPPAISVSSSADVTFPQFSEAGTWNVAQVFLNDAAGNIAIFSTAALAQRGFPTQLTVAGQQDVTLPVLTALSFAPSINTATGPVTLTVQFSATDDLSGVRTMQVLFVSPSGHQQQGGASPNFFPASSVSSSADVTFPQFSEAGTWNVAQVFLNDAAGNIAIFSTATLAQRGFPTQLTVAGNAASVRHRQLWRFRGPPNH